MSVYDAMLRRLQLPETSERLRMLYGSRPEMLQYQLSRYTGAVKRHQALFSASDGPLYLISAPGRAEIAGNHTDHQNGRVLAAAVNLDMLCAVSPRDDLCVRLLSEGYPLIDMDISAHDPVEAERGTTAALIRGIAKGMLDEGRAIRGFDAVVQSDVLSGSGLSSSAAFEVLIAAVFDTLFPSDRPLDAVRRARIAQCAENVYFGKPSGLLDQMAASLGGLSSIDFQSKTPAVEPLQFSFEQVGYRMIVVDTHGSHDQLTGEYAAIRDEMTAVAHACGAQVLRSVTREQVIGGIGHLRRDCGDRAVLRALHFFEEDERVDCQVRNLREGRLSEFLSGIVESGESSWMLLQNVHMPGTAQPLSLALAIARTLLKGRGAWRVHGGGFAGTTLNFVPDDLAPAFISAMESAFGAGCCYQLDVRPVGPALVQKAFVEEETHEQY